LICAFEARPILALCINIPIAMMWVCIGLMFRGATTGER
jgi:hypothetical protein